jgi:hypothetical protein
MMALFLIDLSKNKNHPGSTRCFNLLPIARKGNRQEISFPDPVSGTLQLCTNNLF